LESLCSVGKEKVKVAKARKCKEKKRMAMARIGVRRARQI